MDNKKRNEKNELLITDQTLYLEKEFAFAPINSRDFRVCIYVDDDNKLEQQLTKKQEMEDVIDDIIFGINSDEDTDEQLAEFFLGLKNKINNLWNNIEYIILKFEKNDINDFIKNNSIIKDKKIVIPEFIEITDEEKVNELMHDYFEYKDIIYVCMDMNENYVKLTDCYHAIQTIKKQANQILSLNLSPMETIMYTYDQVRDQVYTRADSKDDSSVARDLCSVLNSDKIVCAGFSNIFYSLLHYMNFECLNVILRNKNPENNIGHQRNIVYVKDEKYNIDGIYYFDVSHDSKKGHDSTDFLSSYRYFAKTRTQITNYDNNSYIDEFCPYYSDDMVTDIENLLDEENLDIIREKYLKSINYMACFVLGEQILDPMTLFEFSPDYNEFDRKELIEKLKIIQEKFDSPISAEKMIMLLNNVRKIQYYQNPGYYPYTLNDLHNIYINSDWNFEEHFYNSFQKLMSRVFEEDVFTIMNMMGLNSTYDKYKDEVFNKFICETKIDQNIKQIQLAKVLQKTYEKKIR